MKTMSTPLLLLVVLLTIASAQVSLTDPYCSAVSNTTELCTECYPGYYQAGVAGGPCVLQDPLCASYSSSEVCTSCYLGYYFAGVAGARCQLLPANSNCATYDFVSGNCLSCWWGAPQGQICA